jgi:hypothetical protein
MGRRRPSMWSRRGQPIPSRAVVAMVNFQAKLNGREPERDADGRCVKTLEMAGLRREYSRRGAQGEWK